MIIIIPCKVVQLPAGSELEIGPNEVSALRLYDTTITPLAREVLFDSDF